MIAPEVDPVGLFQAPLQPIRRSEGILRTIVKPVEVVSHEDGEIGLLALNRSFNLSKVRASMEIPHRDYLHKATCSPLLCVAVPCLEIYGSAASLSLPDPNCFSGPVKIGRPGKAWEEVTPTRRTDLKRGCGLADMANAIRAGRAHRASGELAFHVLNVMAAFEEAALQGRHVEVGSTCERPLAMTAVNATDS